MDYPPVIASLPADDSNATLRKPHEMIVMVPRTGKMALTTRRLYNVMLQLSQARLAASGRMPLADHLFEAPLSALLKSSGSSANTRTVAKNYLQQMQDMKVDWQSTAATGDGLKWKSLTMLSQVEIELRGGDNWVRWAFPPDIMTALFAPERWARIDLDLLTHLTSYQALALYEICARYRDNPGGVTSRQSPQWWLDALSQTPAGTEKREWRKFKSERVNRAVEEINAETDLEIELIEHKEGRAVGEIQFAVRRKAKAARVVQPVEPVDATLVMRAESLGIKEAKLDGLVREFGQGPVSACLAALERRIANRNLRTLENPYSYLRSLLREGEPFEAGELLPPAPIRPADAPAGRATDGSPAPRGPLPGSAPGQAVQGQDALAAELAQMSPEERQPYVELAKAEMIERGLWTAVTSRRASQGDVLHGPFGSVLRRVYAEARARHAQPEEVPGA